MKKVIRKCTFETNSSSTHAICICTDKELLKDIEPSKYLYFGIGMHGWEFKTLSTSEEKANYLYTGILACYPDESKEKIEKLESILLDFGCVSTFATPKWREFNNEVYLDHDCGYIDHSDELKEFIDELLDNPTLLYNYLFSDNSYVLKGNDNSDGIPEIYEHYNHYEYYKGN